MTPTSLLGSLLAPSVTLSSALAGGLGAFLGAGIPGVSLAHLGAGQLAADGGVRWGTLAGASVGFVCGVAVLALLRWVGAPRGLFLRTAAWTGAGVLAGPVAIGAGAWVGATAGAGGDGHLTAALAALPTTWPVAACLGLLAAALGLLGAEASDYGQNGPA